MTRRPSGSPSPRRSVAFLADQWIERDGERQQLFAGLLRHLRARQRRRHRPGAAAARDRRRSRPGPAQPCPTCWPATSRRWCTPPSAYARQKDRLQTWAVHGLGRPRLDEHAHRRRAGDHQPAPRAAAALGHLRDPGRAPVLQELEQPYAGDVTVNDAFRPLSRFFDRVEPPRAAAVGAARRDAGAHRPGRDRRGHHRAAAGRAGRGLRLAGRAVRRARLARRPAAARAGRASPRAADVVRGREAAADRRRWRRALLRRRARRCGALCAATGIPVGETQAGKGSLPHGHPQEMGAVGSTGTTAANALAARGRRRHRRRHAVERLHHGVADRLPGPRRPLRQHQRRRLRRRQARRAVRRGRRPRGARRARRRRWSGYCRRRRLPRAPGRAVAPSGTPWSRRPTTRRRGHRPAGRGPAHPGPGARAWSTS